MQAGKSAMASAKEAAANIGASAKSGMDKTKALIEEKAEKMTAHHPAEKEIAEHRKEEKIREAEMRKREAMHHNAAAKEQVATGYNPAAASPVPHGGCATGGEVVQSGPTGLATGTERPSAARNPRVGGDVETGLGTGGRYA